MKKGIQIRDVLFRYATSIEEKTDEPSINRCSVIWFRHSRLKKYFDLWMHPLWIKRWTDNTIRRCSSVAPYLESSNIMYWNPLWIKWRFTSMVRRSIDGWLMPLVFPHLVKIPWLFSIYWVAHLQLPPTVCRLNDGPSIASICLFLQF